MMLYYIICPRSDRITCGSSRIAYSCLECRLDMLATVYEAKLDRANAECRRVQGVLSQIPIVDANEKQAQASAEYFIPVSIVSLSILQDARSIR